MDTRIVGGDQNRRPIVAASVDQVGQKGALNVLISGPSGEQLISGVEFRKVYYDLDGSNNTTYAGRYRNASAVSGDQDCLITKYTYDGSNNVRRQQTLTGSWTNHAGLAWE